MSRLPKGEAGQTPKAKLDRAREEAEVLDLVRQGVNFREIAERLDCSVSTAYKRYVDGRKAIPREMAEDVLSEVREVARAVRAAHWDRRHDAESGKLILLADKNILATLPARTELTGKDGGPLVGVTATPAEARKIMNELFPGNVGPIVTPDDGGAPKEPPPE